MVTLASLQLWIGLGISAALLVVLMGALIKSRYKIFDSSNFVLHFRRGKLRNKSYGGSFFLLPVFDKYVVLSTAIQQVEIHAQEKVITRENQPVIVNGLLVWRIIDPEAAYRAIGSQYGRNAMLGLNKTLEQIVESIIRTTVAKLTIDEVLRERQIIVEAITKELFGVVSDWGISIETVEVVQVELTNSTLFQHLQAKFEQEARKRAMEITIETDRELEQKRIEQNFEVEKIKAERELELRLYRAELEEKAKKRELERDKQIVEMQKQVELAETQKQREVQTLEQLKEKEVGELSRLKEVEFAKLEREKELSEAKIAKQTKEIKAETQFIERTKAAEAKKLELIKTQIQVAAEKELREAQAHVEAIRLQTEAEARKIKMMAEAEAERKRKIAQATREALLAEAEGKKAVLLAEAEGLAEKVRAQQQINEAMLMKELILQLPEIAKSIKIGEISWLNLGGGTPDDNGKGNGSPLSIIPKNMLELLGIARHFGLDIPRLVETVKKQDIKQSSNPSKGEKTATKPRDRSQAVPKKA